MPDTKLQSLRRALHMNAFMNLSSQKIFSLAAAMLISVLLARYLGPESYGIYVFVTAFIPLAAAPITGGLPSLLTREVAKHHHNDSRADFWATVTTTRRLIIGASVIPLVLCVMGVFYFAPFSIGFMGSLCLLAVPFLMFEAANNGFIRGLHKPVLAEFSKKVVQPLCLGGLLLALVASNLLTVPTAVLCFIAAAACSTLTSYFFYRKARPDQGRSEQTVIEQRAFLKALLSISAVTLLIELNMQLGVLILGALDQHVEAGAFRIAQRASQLAILPVSIINLILAPQIAAAYQEGDSAELQRLATRAGRSCFLVALPSVPLFWFFGERLIEVIFGPGYISSTATALFILVTGQAIALVFGSVWTLMMMTGHERRAMTGLILAVALQLILCVLLAPAHGALGAAVATSTSLRLWRCIFALNLRKLIQINPSAV
jgi:O-antigen/teichoic acid export membrane protein